MDTEDKELKAMLDITGALGELDGEARDRVLAYVFNRLGISFESTGMQSTLPSLPASQSTQNANLITAPPVGSSRAQQDIRSLKEEKKPATTVEMAVLVGYYLEEFAPEAEKKTELNTADITKYFKQAGYPLPTAPKMVLVHGKNAGYFESIEKGLFKLNPVGYNLAAYSMGQEGTGVRTPKKKTVKKAGPVKKSSATKKTAVKAIKKVGKK